MLTHHRFGLLMMPSNTVLNSVLKLPDVFELQARHRCFKGEQRFYSHLSSKTGVKMRFGVYFPPAALNENTPQKPCVALIFLGGLTTNEETFAIKAHAQKMASALNLIIITPDSSPRGADVPDDTAWDLGQGAGFYVDATEQPWATHFKMESYLIHELIPTLQQALSIEQLGIFGHSMGGHGALTLALRHHDLFKSVSALAPICAPVQCAWGQKAFTAYLGTDQTTWAEHDATQLILAKGNQAKPLFNSILIDQGTGDQFLNNPNQLMPETFAAACQSVNQPLQLRYHEGYDHAYYFIQTVVADHLRFHFTQLTGQLPT